VLEALIRRYWPAVAVSTLALALATVAIGYLQDNLGVPNPSALYLVAVVASALVAGTVGAVLTSVAAFLLYNYLFTEPRYTLSMHEPGVWLSVVLLLFVGIVVGQLAALMRSRAETGETREREARALFGLSRALATRRSTDEALREITDRLQTDTHMAIVWIALGAEMAERVVATAGVTGGAQSLGPQGGVVTVLRRMPGEEPARWVRIHQPSTRIGGRSGLDAYRVWIEGVGGAVLGSIWSLRDRHLGSPDQTETRLLSAAADQVGQVLVQDRLAAESQAAEIARQSDALKSALLQSVSHDLRTPLATIRAAAGTLRSDGLDPASQQASAEAIDREAEYLNQLVTNLLDLSRIEAGAVRAEKDAVELDDVLERAIQRLRSRGNSRPLEVALDAPPVEIDPVLLDQVFTNVVENALRHTPPGAPIRVTAHAADDARVRLTVEDGGPGVPPEALAKLFEKFYRVPGRRESPRGGTGVGLAVVRGLVEAMGGTVRARTSELGGLAIDIDLPRALMPADLAARAAS
jgi:two-component system, OmpR family, sensor histidine kinase KdpD